MICSFPLLMVSLSVTAPPAAAPPTVPPCVEEANALLQRKDFADALVTADLCGAETDHPRNLYLAGVARIALNQHAQAILVLRRYLADDAPGEPKRLRDIANSRLEQAKAQAVPVLLRIVPAAGEGETKILAEREEESNDPIRTPLSALEEQDGGRILWLDPGLYRVTVRGEGDLSATQAVTVIAGAAGVVLTVSLQAPVVAPPPPPPRMPVFPRRPWLALTGAAGGVNVVAGLSLLSLGSVRGARQLEAGANTCRPIGELEGCRENFGKAVALRGAGAGLLGAGLGLLAGGLTALVSRPSRRKLAWSIEAGLGGGVLLAGAVLLGVGLRNFNQINTDASLDALLWEAGYQNKVSERANQYTIGAWLVGAGVGLGASAALGLLVQRLAPKRTAAAGRLQLRSQGIAIAF